MKLVICTVCCIAAGSVSFYWIMLPQVGPQDRGVTDSPQSAAALASTGGSPDGIAGQGFIEPATEVRALAFEVSGVIDRCLVTVGQRVNRSEPLMVLANADATQALSVAERERDLARARRARTLRGANPHEVAAAEHRLEARRRRLAFVRKESERVQQLAGQNAATMRDRDEVTVSVQEAEADRDAAEADWNALKNSVLEEDKQVTDAEVALAEARVEQARANLGRTTLEAPFDGTVLEILKHPGEANFSEANEPVLLFADLTRLRVRAEIDERNAHRLRPGQRAAIFGTNLGAQRYEGRVTLVKAIMGQKSVFTRHSTERKDLEVRQVLVDMPHHFQAPVGLRVDIVILPES